MIEQRLVSVGEGNEFGEPEGPAAALDRMDGAKHSIQAIGGAVTRLNGRELLFELVHQLRAFVEIGCLEVVEIAHLSLCALLGSLILGGSLASGLRGG